MLVTGQVQRSDFSANRASAKSLLGLGIVCLRAEPARTQLKSVVKNRATKQIEKGVRTAKAFPVSAQAFAGYCDAETRIAAVASLPNKFQQMTRKNINGEPSLQIEREFTNTKPIGTHNARFDFASGLWIPT